jgi:predicted DCC family thiol-disulfide oxidoreductase YuxK
MPDCPKCNGKLRRINRRPLDRSISLVYPVARYRCAGRECGWEGTIGDYRKAAERMLRLLSWPFLFVVTYFVMKKIIR